MITLKQHITIPRIIGIALLIIAALAFQTQGLLRTSILAIVGLVLLLTPSKISMKRWQEFVASVKPTKEFVTIMFFDALFWAVLAVLFLVLANVLRAPYEQLKLAQLSQTGVTLGSLEAANAIIEHFFTIAISSIIVFWLIVILAYSLSRGMIWLTLLNKKTQKAFFARFSLLNLAWGTIWIASALFLIATMNRAVAPYVFIVLLLLYAHLTTVLHYSYAHHHRAGRAVKEAFNTFASSGRFAHPYCYLFVVYLILNQLMRVAQGTTAIVITAFLGLVFMAWYRAYFRNIMRHP